MVCSDNQEEIGGYKSLAEYMGATVEEVEEPVEATRSRNLQRCFNPHGPVPFGDASHVKIQRVGRPTNDQKSVCSRANNTLAEGEAAIVRFIRGRGRAEGGVRCHRTERSGAPDALAADRRYIASPGKVSPAGFAGSATLDLNQGRMPTIRCR